MINHSADQTKCVILMIILPISNSNLTKFEDYRSTNQIFGHMLGKRKEPDDTRPEPSQEDRIKSLKNRLETQLKEHESIAEKENEAMAKKLDTEKKAIQALELQRLCGEEMPQSSSNAQPDSTSFDLKSSIDGLKVSMESNFKSLSECY